MFDQRGAMRSEPFGCLEENTPQHLIDAICSTCLPNPSFVEEMMENDKAVLGVTRIFFHYAKSNLFLEQNQILSRMQRIAHLPAIIVQGRYDVVCPPEIAYSLYENWTGSNLWIIPNGGHSDDEIPMVAGFSCSD